MEVAEKLEYREEDLEQWRAGAENFRAFWKEVISTEDKFENYIHQDIGTVQALFLGERGMVADSELQKYSQLFEAKFGIKSRENLLYRPEIVEKIIDQDPEIFSGLIDIGASDRVERLMDKMKNHEFHRYQLAAGLLLGFPREAIDFFIKRDADPRAKIHSDVLRKIQEKRGLTALAEIEKITDIEKRVKAILTLTNYLNIHTDDETRMAFEFFYRNIGSPAEYYGVSWANPAQPSNATIAHGQRLKAAFELSGILDVFNPNSIYPVDTIDTSTHPLAVQEREVRDRIRGLLKEE